MAFKRSGVRLPLAPPSTKPLLSILRRPRRARSPARQHHHVAICMGVAIVREPVATDIGRGLAIRLPCALARGAFAVEFRLFRRRHRRWGHGRRRDLIGAIDAHSVALRIGATRRGCLLSAFVSGDGRALAGGGTGAVNEGSCARAAAGRASRASSMIRWRPENLATRCAFQLQLPLNRNSQAAGELMSITARGTPGSDKSYRERAVHA
jgi:hypothetical protein